MLIKVGGTQLEELSGSGVLGWIFER